MLWAPLVLSHFNLQATETTLTECLTIVPQSRGGRIPFPTDPIVQARVDGTFQWPSIGDEVGDRKWEATKANASGTFEGRAFQGGYAAFSVMWPKDEVVLLNATGSNMVYANGEPRMGDVYGFGYTQIPIQFRKGPNELLVATGRGRLTMKLQVPKASAVLNTGDLTLPDVVEGESGSYFGGVIVVNAEGRARKNLELIASYDGTRSTIRVPVISPLASRKCRFDLPKLTQPKGETYDVVVELREAGRVLDKATIQIRHRKSTQSRRVTFVSEMDGSVQYFAVQPPPVPKPGLALILTVHGASVEAQGQAEAYSPKDWCWVVAATNRRPYGFDWEDWGRKDAMEVLRHAQAKYKTDEKRTYLTGHSMGGHGTWQLGAHYPNVFAAIAPSAGWRSFYTYVGKPRIANPTPMEAFFERVVSPTDTERLLENHRTQDVYILHGDADDNVPVSEARAMRDHFAKMGKAIGYYEEPKAGHWWDGDRSTGADCVDWPGIFDMFKKKTLNRWQGDVLEFSTLDPSISSRMDFFEVLQQDKRRELSTVKAVAGKDGIVVTTTNVRAIRLGPGPVMMDGQPLKGLVKAKGVPATFEKVAGKWVWRAKGVEVQPGPLKDAFDRRMVFVYGTKGSKEENAWSYAKARFDAEQWWYRGNGAIDVVPDTEAPVNDRRRNLILYGNDSSNAAWSKVVDDATHKKMEKEMIDPAIGMVMVEEFGVLASMRTGDRQVAWIGSSSMVGCRTLERLPYFSAGIAYPDWTLIGTSTPTKGTAGVIGAGFWDEKGVFRAK